MTKPVTKQFNQGDKPVIACINQATVGLGVDFDKLIAAMQQYVDQYVVPRWGTPATLVKASAPIKGAWVMVFLDNADVQGALAYHDLTADGFPISKVFVKTTLAAGDLVSVSASHELVEALVDPAINMMCTGPNSRLTYAYESADPVEESSFPVNGIQMSDFVYPSYFESFRKAGSVKFDEVGKISKPFQILSGGYQSVFDGRRWKNIFGSMAKEKRFAKEDRRGHRSEIRKERWKSRGK